jgi:hypothetical protein
MRSTRYPAVWSVASRLRSRSNARRLRWNSYPSRSTTSLACGHRKSTSRPATGTLTAGGGKTRTSAQAQEAALELGSRCGEGSVTRKQGAESAKPLRPRLASHRRESSVAWSRPLRSALSIARASRRGESDVARSSRVRDGAVTGTRSRVVRAPSSTHARWNTMPRRRRLPPGTVTCAGPAIGSTILHSAAALVWLNRAFRPPASTAAIHRPCSASGRPATAYTPACRRVSHPDASSRPIVELLTPADSSWRLATTPCWRLASSTTIGGA